MHCCVRGSDEQRAALLLADKYCPHAVAWAPVYCRPRNRPATPSSSVLCSVCPVWFRVIATFCCRQRRRLRAPARRGADGQPAGAAAAAVGLWPTHGGVGDRASRAAGAAGSAGEGGCVGGAAQAVKPGRRMNTWRLSRTPLPRLDQGNTQCCGIACPRYQLQCPPTREDLPTSQRGPSAAYSCAYICAAALHSRDVWDRRHRPAAALRRSGLGPPRPLLALDPLAQPQHVRVQCAEPGVQLRREPPVVCFRRRRDQQPPPSSGGFRSPRRARPLQPLRPVRLWLRFGSAAGGCAASSSGWRRAWRRDDWRRNRRRRPAAWRHRRLRFQLWACLRLRLRLRL